MPLENYPPKKEDIIRLQKYTIFDEWFNTITPVPGNLKRNDVNPNYIRSALPMTISKISADFLFGEIPIITYQDEKIDENLQTIIRDTQFNDVLYEDALTNSYSGDGVLNVYREDNNVFIQSVKPDFYFPELHPLDPKRILKNRFIYPITVMEGKKEVKYLYVVIDDGKNIYRNLYIQDGEKIIETSLDNIDLGREVKPIEKNPTGKFLAYHTSNFSVSGKFFGISDYQGLVNMFEELSNRFSRQSNILDEHAAPKLAVPPGVLDENGNYEKESLEVIEINPMEGNPIKPEYITWDGRLEESFKQINYILDNIVRDSEIPFSFFGLKDGGQAESGKALKYRLLRLLAKSRRKMRYYDTTIKNTLAVAYQLKYNKEIKPNDINIEFGDGLPLDEEFEADVVEKLRRAGAISIEEAVRRTSRKQGDELDEEIDNVKKSETINPPSTVGPQIAIPKPPTQ